MGLAALLVLTGCGQTHELTRPPEPPLSLTDQLAVGLAMVLVGVLWVALAVRVLGRARDAVRSGLGAALLAPVVAVAGFLAYGVAEGVRRRQILGGGRCRALPVEERPQTIADIRCGPFEGLGYALAAWLMVPAALVLAVVAVLTLRGHPWPRVALVAAFGVVTLAALYATTL